MNRHLAALAILAPLAACASPAQITTALSSPAGRLFCAIQMAGGGSFVATLTADAAAGALPSLAPLAVIATNAGKAAVDADCAKAAMVVGGASGVAVSPPPVVTGVPNISIVAPESPTKAM